MNVEFSMVLDDPENPTSMIVTIPIGHIAEDASNMRYYFMRGWVDELKDKCIKIMLEIRMKKKSSGIILPTVQ